MKKSLILVGLLSIGYAHAQEGRVGINTETPTATLNVKSKVNNGKNLELENLSGTKLVTVLDNGKIGFNNPSPQYRLDIVGINDSYAGNTIALRGFRDNNGSLGLDIYKARGTKDTPKVLQLNDIIGHVSFSPYNGTKYIGSTSIGSTVTGEVTTDKVPSSIDFKVYKYGVDIAATTNNIAMRVYHDGNIGMGVLEPTNKLHVKGTNPIRLEGLQVGSSTDKVVVVDATGVLKTVDRNSISGTQGIAQEVDGIIGNEVVDATPNRGLERSGNGDASSQYTLGIKDGGVTGAMLAANSVDGSKIASNAVTGDKIANGSVSSAKLNIPGQADQVLTYKDGKWVAADAKGLTAGVNKGDMLVWNGTSWVTKSYKVVRTAETSYTVTDEDLIVSTTSQAGFAITLPTTDEYRYKGRKVCFFVKDPNTTGNFSPSITGGYNYVNGTSSNCVLWDGEEWLPIVGG